MKKNLPYNPRLESISKKAGKAMGDYAMFKDGDRVVVAVSGGKDSLSLLKILEYRQHFIPIKIELLAVHIDSGIPGFPISQLEKIFQQWDVPFYVKKIDFLQGKTFEDIDCFWCSWNRRKALFEFAQENGFNKIALGHHLDDIAETILMNLFYRGEISAMCPKQELFQGKLTLIRPFAYVREEEIIRFAREMGIVEVSSFVCPHADRSVRMAIKKFLLEWEKKNPAIKMNILKGLTNIKSEYLLDSLNA